MLNGQGWKPVQGAEGTDSARWQTSIQEAWSRLLYVAHAVNTYGSKEYCRSATREADLYMHTQRSAKQLMDSLEATCRQQWEVLKVNRNKLQVGQPPSGPLDYLPG